MLGFGRRSRLITTGTVCVALAAPVYAKDEPDKPEEPPAKLTRSQPKIPGADAAKLIASPHPPKALEVPVYRPPRRGSPRTKVGGGLRGSRAVPEPLALAPDHVGQTACSNPSLFWYIDAVPVRGTPVVFTLMEADGMDPVVETTLELPTAPGIQRIRLEELGVDLRPGLEYEWSISLVVDPEQRSRDSVTTGYIERVSAPVFQPPGPDLALLQAEAGLWYDALESISDSLGREPDDVELRRKRSTLLRQAGLEAASNGE